MDLLTNPEMPKSEKSIQWFYLLALSLAAAAFIRATCRAENPPAVVAQSFPGLAWQ